MTRRSVIARHRLGLAQARGSPMPSWPSGSTPPTNGSSSAPASAAATSPATARPPRRLATEAARKALEHAGIDAERDRPDRARHRDARPDLPVSATKVQATLGIDDCIAFDVPAVCTGFLYALSVADSMLRAGMAEHALVIGSETFSRILDWEDRATCVLFGDGAGAVVLERRGRRRARHPRHQAPCRRPPQRLALRRRRPLDHRHGRQAADEGQRGVPPRGRQSRRRAERSARRRPASTAAEIDWVVPHQANARILDATAQQARPAAGKGRRHRRPHANTSAASVPLALDAAVRDGRIKRGDLIVLEAMGGGFTWGAAALRY